MFGSEIRSRGLKSYDISRKQVPLSPILSVESGHSYSENDSDDRDRSPCAHLGAGETPTRSSVVRTRGVGQGLSQQTFPRS